MYILTVLGDEETGAYSVANEDGDKVLYMFEEEDDADRYAMLLAEEGYPVMTVMEVDDEILYHVCDINDHEYTIITPNDIVIPPPLDDRPVS
jgi:dGTP triphosphohydrolase